MLCRWPCPAFCEAIKNKSFGRENVYIVAGSWLIFLSLSAKKKSMVFTFLEVICHYFA